MDGKSDADTALRLIGRQPVTLEAFGKIAERAGTVVQRVRKAMLAPNAKKQAPTFGTAHMAAIVGLDPKHIDYRAKKGDLPPGQTASHRRAFTLSDVRAWSRELRKSKLRPEGAEAVTIATANFKGGVTKTTTAVTLAQGLAMRGHKVLLIDADPQGSATSLFGYLPDAEIDEDETILPLCRGARDSIEYAIRETYWEGIDLVPAVSDLFSAEFDLPARQMNVRNFQFWNVLHNGIDNARLKYDAIIIDTPPALSYLTINALMAADGILMPLPPSSLDFLSSTQFWSLVSVLTEGLQKHGAVKQFEFINVLLSKVDPEDLSAPVVREWITAAYGEKVMPVEVPLTRTAGSASAEFGTVYDQPRKRATQTYDRVVEHIEEQMGVAWLRQLSGNTMGEAA
ncbi:ParA family protein [Methylibium petroleiphilum]|uniref:Partitioning protein, ParA n=1 Tax=Methylibium petroleiphilum (strain ATCC BAA-1232 / LMG 22953 / PM1) TaxID=420662 RepID=A2SMR8_METPP|nr:AAA family ATPase [Methylibium petroleiphilum]ABM96857.1 partitioning protein, ParA [Methylibium petroleiphilum PM1]